MEKTISSGNINLVDNKKIKFIMKKIIKYKYSEYCTPKGLEDLRKQICMFLSKQNINTTYKNILITSGSQQSINLVIDALKIKTILIEQPTYFGALQVFKNKEMNILGINIFENGIDLANLENIIIKNNIRLIYVVPTFNNPTGFSWENDNRKQFLNIINKYNIIVIEDDPYSLINFTNNKYDSLYTLNKGKNIIYLGTFSKYITPALNIGYIVADTEIINKLYNIKSSYDLCSPIFNQVFILNYLKKYDIIKIIKKKIPIFLKKKKKIESELKNIFKDNIKLSDSKGGIFMLAELKNKNELCENNTLYYLKDENKNIFRVNILF